MTIERYTLDQLQILMLVASAEHPFITAINVRARWRYIHLVANEAVDGRILDPALPQITRNPAASAARAAGIITALDEWIAEHAARS